MAGDDARLQRLEEEVARLRAAATASTNAARGDKAAVEALTRDSHARKGASSKMQAWQADAEQWRGRVDSALERHDAKGAELDAASRQVREAVQRSASHAEVRGILDAARRQAQAAAQAAVAAGASATEQEVEALRRQVAALRLQTGDALAGDDAAVEAAVTAALGAAEKKLEARLSATLGASLRAEAAEAGLDARRALEASFDSRAAAVAARRAEGDDAAAAAVDKAVAELIKSVDAARDEVRVLKETRDSDAADALLQKKKFEAALDVVETNAQSQIGQVLEATRAARAALGDATNAARAGLDGVRSELLSALDARADDWRDDRADLKRGVARCDRAIAAIEGEASRAVFAFETRTLRALDRPAFGAARPNVPGDARRGR